VVLLLWWVMTGDHLATVVERVTTSRVSEGIGGGGGGGGNDASVDYKLGC